MPKLSEKERAFLREYAALCRKHRFYLDGCGCCGSPVLLPLDPFTVLTYKRGPTEVIFRQRLETDQEVF